MITQNAYNRLEHLTFKGNLEYTRYGWLRLTPAYSIHLVSDLLAAHTGEDLTVLDPFCGTGTTALVCAERGIACDTTDINPFLIWLSETKTRSYDSYELKVLKLASMEVMEAIRSRREETAWIPPMHQIEKWWDESTLNALARAMCKIRELACAVPESTRSLLKIIFCRTMIEQANVSFGHQSMSFKARERTMFLLETPEDLVVESWERYSRLVEKAACSPITTSPRVIFHDARHLNTGLAANHYSCVITSPPYPNRMSYIRELRPYMYWLGYLDSGRAAGELDWQAIGGTWGMATSNLNRWESDPIIAIPFANFSAILANIAYHSPLLSRYVHKYFHDMVLHCKGLFQVVKPSGIIHYIVGNSKFYDVLLPVDTIFASLFEAVGFVDVTINVIRKRSSKKELFEYVVSARKP